MFLSVDWAKRWLPAVFILLSLFLPWWTLVDTTGWMTRVYSGTTTLDLSFPWEDDLIIYYDRTVGHIVANYTVDLSRIPQLFFVSALIVAGGLFGLSSKSRTRTLGGLLGIASIVSYFILVFHSSHWGSLVWDGWWNLRSYFGIYHGYYTPRPKLHLTGETGEIFPYTNIWFLSVGFYLALAGSLMLLLPPITEKLRKREIGEIEAGKRPTGLTIIAILWLLGGIYNLYMSSQGISANLAVLPYYWRRADIMRYQWFQFAVPAELAISILVFALGLIQIFTIYGLWTRKSWSYKLALAVPVFGVVTWILMIGLYMSAPIELGIWESINLVPVVSSTFWMIIYWSYLRQSHVKEYLGI